MKKIMFNDKYGLTAAVLRGEKTQTRRDATRLAIDHEAGKKTGWYHNLSVEEYILRNASYKVGEVIAVAQSYEQVKSHLGAMARCIINPFGSPREHPGWTNKMVVKADLMPYRILITDVRVQRLQDISDEDCQKEGVVATHGGYGVEEGLNYQVFASTPREAFAALIDRVCGRGTWESNPYVLAYDFELVTDCNRLINI